MYFRPLFRLFRPMLCILLRFTHLLNNHLIFRIFFILSASYFSVFPPVASFVQTQPYIGKSPSYRRQQPQNPSISSFQEPPQRTKENRRSRKSPSSDTKPGSFAARILQESSTLKCKWLSLTSFG